MPINGWGGGGGGGGEQKSSTDSNICHTYPTMMKLGTVIPCIKKIQNICKSSDTALEFCWHDHFFTVNQQILLYKEIQKKYNSFNFFESLKIVLISMLTILMISGKMATVALPKIKVF